MSDRVVVALIEAEFLRYRSLGLGALKQIQDGANALSEHRVGENSIATIVWHLAGNLESRFTEFLTTDGEKPWRNRDDEFLERECTTDDVIAKWERGWRVLLGTLSALTDETLARHVSIRGVALRVDEALLRSLAHTSYHVGQIVFAAKQRRGAAWNSLSIPLGSSATYNAHPSLEKPRDYAATYDHT